MYHAAIGEENLNGHEMEILANQERQPCDVALLTHLCIGLPVRGHLETIVCA
jgi:hypothetical protein